MTALPGLLLTVALLQVLPGNVSGVDEKGLHVSEVIFALGSMALGAMSVAVGMGAVLEVPVAGTILLAGGSLLSVGVPAAKWVERREESEWS